MAEIRIEGLTRRFGNVRAVDDVSLDVADGDFLVLLGPSGCGKTTLLRMIAGLLEPSEGRIMLGDRDITHVPARRRDLAMVFQSYALYPHLTVERNIGFPLRAARRPKAEIARRVREVADQLELGGLLHRRPRELSGGQRQRVALGRALVRDPQAFLMDEPLSNLDAKLRTATRTELAGLHRRLGRTFIYVTHDQVEAMSMATRVVLLNGGRVEQVGSPTEVYDTPASVFVAGFLGAPPMNLIEARVEADGDLLAVRADGLRIPLWPGFDEPRDVIVGLRPENLTLLPGSAESPRPAEPPHPAEASTASPGLTASPGSTAQIEGVVTTVENLGSEEVAWCDVHGQAVALRGPRPIGLAAGDRARLTVDVSRVHLFARASGRRLAWRPPDPRESLTIPVPGALAASPSPASPAPAAV
ncbi:ABC transporter ATP-binding protein [Frankia sp. CcI156]|uniref:Carbohydrate ABC transporter ATP-binding protein, CUT1 family n=1 Tax=Frankia casuarinae (strain DSM 45818 / CECT 9043 / HFP020203 / CcI3) TaxID=106370 RepID=Q2J951_FRACC|nr:MULTISPECIES: ABC transporter ATP-binding protein [Frankia]ABD12191.1 carbohydrate ABC transporter ATP-binding protein, CUT1 family [Frankia casuarinae]ETA02489.1 carbohydrate ABC transporter ATP-binding protein, CUT1 family [Frankia sp. CcI6]EYT92117.1 carbohydrate ABC transporter ATP-binding protein, CUT1 family [Frankia casuarinae]KDA43148.1 carbohydrate ABC transporter ATP-binding protein, CUT1 family [Frankia sp. BMG5.23]KFB04848.1 carbohydrate ABC transporter ATP-binding protein, CUT1